MPDPERSLGGKPYEMAPGVYYLEVGKGFLRSNVYFVRADSSWALIDTGSAKSDHVIKKAAESLFGQGVAPASILLTHDHPDHSGSARRLAQTWDCTVWVHPDELPLARGDISTFHEYANPLDRWIVLPSLRLVGSRRRETMVAQANLEDVARSFDPGAVLPGLPDWEAVHTPGHTPGHTAFFRGSDRVLITGDALVTVDLNSVWGFLAKKQKVAGPLWYTTWDRQTARESVLKLANLEPRVLGSGHGIPMTGSGVPSRVRAFADRF